MPNWTTIREGNFRREILENELPVMLEVTAGWTGLGGAWRREIDAVADRYEGRIAFAIVDIDDTPGFALNYGVKGVPLRMFYKDGKCSSYLLAIHREEDIAEWLDDCMAGGARGTLREAGGWPDADNGDAG